MKFYNKEETQHHLKVCIAVKNHLINKHNIMAKREWYIILDDEDKIIGSPLPGITIAQKSRKQKYRNPDLLWYWGENLYILEIDGFVHYTKSSKTEKRNTIYKNNNCHFIIIETFELVNGKVKNKPIEKILKELDEKII